MGVRMKEILKNPKFLLATSVFIYVIAVGLFIQFILLPYIFPQAHYKYGILIRGDTILFHEEAVRIAKEVESKGWQAWSLRPNPFGVSMIGITSFFYIITGIHKPYIMLFYNATLHALFALSLVKLLESFGLKTKFAILGALPIIFSPSTFIWNGQIHKEGIYVLGFTLLFWSISEAIKGSVRSLIFSVLTQAIGIGLIFLVREHIVLAIKYIFASITAFTLALIGFSLVKRIARLNLLISLLIFSLVVFGYSSLITSASYVSTNVETSVTSFDYSKIVIHSPELAESLGIKSAVAKTTKAKTETKIEWTHQFFVPKKIDNILRSLATIRYEFLNKYFTDAPGNIEWDSMLSKATDFLVYMPRGLFVGLFLGPDFWFYWFVKGGTATGLFTRCVAPTETIIIFFALLSFPIAFYKLRKNPAFYIILLLCLVFIYIHVITEPNAGTIVRKRYVFISFIVSLSFAYLLMWWSSWRAKRSS